MRELDVRRLPPREKHPAVFALLDGLDVGETLLIVNDHEPDPLRRQLARRPGLFAWDVVEAGPERWRVAVRKLRAGTVEPSSPLDPFPRIVE